MTDRDTQRILEICESLDWFNPMVVKMLCEDNARLRALVKKVEEGSGDMSCPWCVGKVYTKTPHSPDCPALNPDGSVK